MSKRWIRCSRETRSLTSELNLMRRELQTLQWSCAGVIILMSFLCLWMIRMRRSLVQSSPTESPVVSPRGDAAATAVRVSNAAPSPQRQTARYRRRVNVTPTVPQEALMSCFHRRSAVTTQNGLNEQDPHSSNFQSSKSMAQAWWAKLQRRQR